MQKVNFTSLKSILAYINIQIIYYLLAAAFGALAFFIVASILLLYDKLK